MMNMTNVPPGNAAVLPPFASAVTPLASGGRALSSSTTTTSPGAFRSRVASSNAQSDVSSVAPHHVMDDLLRRYLEKRGYRVEKADVDMENVEKHASNGILTSPSSALEQYARQLGLSTDACAANHLLFYGVLNGDPSAVEQAYVALSEWICNSLDMYKYELHAVAFPLFVHCYLELILQGFPEHARAFFTKHHHDHMCLHVEELRQLSMIFTPAQVQTNEYAQQVLQSKFNLQMSLLSFELLNTFLRQERLFLLLSMLNARVNLIVTSNQPAMQVQQLEDGMIANLKTLEVAKASSGYKSPDAMAQVVAASTQPNESEIGVPLTSGTFDLEYLVHSAGGHGDTLDDLHAIRVLWGVLPERKLPVDKDEAATANSATENEDGVSTTTANNGDASMITTDSTNKKESNGTTTSDPSDLPSKGDKNAKSKDKTSTDAQRKAKRVKLSNSTDTKEKSQLEIIGPIPDRKNPFHAEILEKLVVRQPSEMKALALEDLRSRAALDKSNLPSSLCFTFMNASAHINNVCFSDDVTMVGASCEDGTFRVWRNDDQPLGTATGCVYHGGSHAQDLEDICEEDEKMAVLRGHSSAVYGASFSPDNRFALTASADSTVRLWSLAARSNMVIYRSHSSFPVWDVQFGPHGYYFASCSMDRTARLWSTDHVSPLRVFAGHLSDVDCVQFHPNHHYLATGSSDKTVRLWDLQSGKCLRIFTGHFHGVKCLAFSRNGRYLASSGDDQYINIWDLQAGKRLETLVGHKAMVTSLDFSRESSILASSGMDSTVRLWDMKSIADKPLVASMNMSTDDNVDVISRMKGSVIQSAGHLSFVKPLSMVRPSPMQELPPSRFLLKTLRSKQTPMYRVHFTPRNLLLTGGVLHPKSDS